MAKTGSQKSHAAGFTLLEMAIVLSIMSVVSIAMVALFSAQLRKTQYRQTVAKMEAIQQALFYYRITYNRLPCPANANLAINAVGYGLEGTSPGFCSNANFSQNPTVGLQDAKEGMVPTKTLQLPDEYGFDGWGRRMMYIVSGDFTQGGAFSAISAYDSTVRMTILNAQGTATTNQAGEVLISFGQNGHGAYPRNGGGTRINASSDNVDELNNCDCDNSAVSTGLNATFVQKDATQDAADALNSFDDIVYFAGRGSYILPSSLTQQPFTFSAGGGATGCLGGPPICQVHSGVKQCMCGY